MAQKQKNNHFMRNLNFKLNSHLLNIKSSNAKLNYLPNKKQQVEHLVGKKIFSCID